MAELFVSDEGFEREPIRYCLYCGDDIPDGKRGHALFCTRSHAVLAAQWRARERDFRRAVRAIHNRPRRRLWLRPRRRT